MNFKFHCTHCGQRISAEESKRGTNANCPSCGSIITIPLPAGVSPPAPTHSLPTTPAALAPKKPRFNPKNLKRAPMIGLLLLVVLAIAGFVIKQKSPSAEYRKQMDEFIREASILNSYTGQGVSFVNCGDQLARVKAAYDLVDNGKPGRGITQRTCFDKAMKGWLLTYGIWRKHRGNDYLITPNETEDVNALLAAIDQPPVEVGSSMYVDFSGTNFISLSKVLRAGFGFASKNFEMGRKDVIEHP